jgi:hypothetical protein
MTWNEFVEEVERQMEEGDIDPDSELWYIDICGEWDIKHIHVSFDEVMGINI